MGIEKGGGMQKKLTILVDLDEVMNNLVEVWVSRINEIYGLNVNFNDISQWELETFFPSLTKSQVYKPLHEKSLWERLAPQEGCQKTLKKWIDAGHTVMITTSTFYKHAETKGEWLKHYFPFLTWDNVIITSKKHLIKGDVLIDDGLHNLQSGDFIKVIMTRPWNKSFDEKANGMFRIHNWQEAEILIERIGRGEIK